MKPRNREINIFNISMLDVISGAMGAFLIIMVVLLPYYKKDIKDLITRVKSLVIERDEVRMERDKALSDAGLLEIELVEARETAEGLAAELDGARESADSLAAGLANSLAKADSLAAKISEANLMERLVNNLDIVFVFDATGSMEEEIGDLRKNMTGIVQVLQLLASNLHVGFVAYRDWEDDPVTMEFQLQSMSRSGQTRLQSFLTGVNAIGGGSTFEEAVDAGIKKALAMSWRDGVRQVIVLIGDAPVHSEQYSDLIAIVSRFRKAGVQRMVSAIYTSAGRNEAAEEFFRRIAEAGRGQFINSSGGSYSGMTAIVLLSVMRR